MDAVVIDGVPGVVVDCEVESLFVVGVVDHDGASGADHVDDACPHEVADAFADFADEDAG